MEEEEIVVLVEIVRRSRALTNDVFPLPHFDDSIDYAICEAAEYLDARLRLRRTEDKRNHRRAADPRAEWGQCGYMIASALMQCEYEPSPAPRWSSGVYAVIERLALAHSGDTDSLAQALSLWSRECRAYGWQPAKLLAETCAAFEKKHIPAGVERWAA